MLFVGMLKIIDSVIVGMSCQALGHKRAWRRDSKLILTGWSQRLHLAVKKAMIRRGWSMATIPAEAHSTENE